MSKGDKFYLFSDGFSDQFGGPNGKKFMKKKFINLVAKNVDLKMKDQKKNLTSQLQEWMGSSGTEIEQVDDITNFGIEI
ncbi:MAG: SpoIIE family protein phosphatase [Flavobacteriales bacterium]